MTRPEVGHVYCFPGEPFRWLVCIRVESAVAERYVATFMYDGGARFKGALLVEHHTANTCERALAEVSDGAERDELIARVQREHPPRTEPEDGVSAYYRQHSDRASALHFELQQAKAHGAPGAELKRIERALESARYVGD